MKQVENRQLEVAVDDETSGVPNFRDLNEWPLVPRGELVLLDVQLLDFRVQRRAGNSEFRCRTFWACNFPFTFR